MMTMQQTVWLQRNDDCRLFFIRKRESSSAMIAAQIHSDSEIFFALSPSPLRSARAAGLRVQRVSEPLTRFALRELLLRLLLLLCVKAC